MILKYFSNIFLEERFLFNREPNLHQNGLDHSDSEIPPADISSDCSTVRLSPSITEGTRANQPNISRSENIKITTSIRYIKFYIFVVAAQRKY